MSALDNETESKLYEDLFWSFCYEINEVVKDREPMGELSSDIALEKYKLDIDSPMIESDYIILEYRSDKDTIVTIRTENISLSPIFANGVKKYSIPMLFRNLRDEFSESYGVEFDIENSIKILESNVIDMDSRTVDIRKQIEYGETEEILDSLGINVPYEEIDDDVAAKEFIESAVEFEGVEKQNSSGKRYLVYSSEDLNKTFIVGDGEDQDLFIHPVKQQSSYTIGLSVSKIRSWMGYDYDHDEYYPETGNKTLETGHTVRVQGDMTLEKTLDLRNEKEAVELLEVMEKQIENIDIDEGLLKNKFKFRFNKDGSIADVKLLPNIEEEDIKSNKGVSIMSKDGEIEKDQESIVRAKIETVNDNLIGETGGYYEGEEMELTREPGEVLEKIDNHLVICEEAYECPYSGSSNEPVSVIVPKETAFIMAHDEHGEEVIDIGSGRYEISLLDRV